VHEIDPFKWFNIVLVIISAFNRLLPTHTGEKLMQKTLTLALTEQKFRGEENTLERYSESAGTRHQFKETKATNSLLAWID
jgi:hypothetical protein